MTTRRKPTPPMRKAHRDALRTAVADYMFSEGCSCCRDNEAHDENRATLGKLLGIRPEKDGNELWYDFSKFRSGPK